MELKELYNNNEDDLFEAYLSTPTLSHAFDRRRFIEFALVANKNCSGFNSDRVSALKKKGLSEREIEALRYVYSWLADVVEVLK